MSKQFLMKSIVAAAAMLVSGFAMAEGIEFHGYMRQQAGGSSEGGNLQVFQLPGSQAKYRLGNESDGYTEPSIALPFGDSNGVWAKYKLTLAMKNQGAGNWESTENGDDNFVLAHHENYFSAGGFFGRGALENASVWVGKRFYNRHDVHMNDYYYWSNSGTGAGIEEISAGPAKLSFAYIQNGKNGASPAEIAAGTNVNKRYSMRVYDINAGENGKLEGELVSLNGSSETGATTGSGSVLFLEHTKSGVLGGFNKVALVLGRDQGMGGAWIPNYAGAGEAKGSSVTLLDQFYFDFKGSRWSALGTAIYSKISPSGGTASTWTSFGIRPQYNFNDNWSLAVELGHDRSKDGSNGPTDGAALTKLTIAPQLTLSPGVWARPVLRAFVTHATWNDAAQAKAAAWGSPIANGVFGASTSGTTFGFQAEAWW